MPDPLADSYEFCRKLTRRTATNFYYSFTGLPRDRFKAMCALYAYMRICDDIGDDDSLPLDQRAPALQWWRDIVSMRLTSDDTSPSTPLPDAPFVHETLQNGVLVLPAMRDSLSRFSIPVECLLDVITGVGMDLDALNRSGSLETADADAMCRYQTFEELADYCYHVAGVVGRCCVHVWGFTNPRALTLAIDCGLAFQLTNILRDIAEDADNGRVYLPAEDLRRFNYPVEAIQSRVVDDRFHDLMKFEADRAAEYYSRSRELFQYLEPAGQPILQAMMSIYEGLLTEIRRSDYDVYSRRISLPTWRKLLIATGAAVRHRLKPRAKEATSTSPDGR
jgi:phytoene synthase